MQTFRLDGKYCIGIQRYSLPVQQPVGQRQLVFLLDLCDFIQHIFVVFEGKQFFQFGSVFFKAVSDQFPDQCGKFRIALQKPAAEGDAVRLIIELFRVKTVKVIQFAVFQDFCVQCGDPVRGMGKMDIHMRHMDLSAFVNDCRFGIVRSGACQRIEPFNDWKELRHDLFQIAAGAIFQALPRGSYGSCRRRYP